MNVDVGRTTEALNQRDRTAVGVAGVEVGLTEQVACDDTVHHLQHLHHQLGQCGQKQAQRDG